MAQGTVVEPTICACFVLSHPGADPVAPQLWKLLETLCKSWLVVIPVPHQDSRLRHSSRSFCDTFPGKIVYCASGEDPYAMALREAHGGASHLWLLDSCSIVVMPPLYRFANLQESGSITHQINEREWQWRRTLVSTRLNWAYDPGSQQWWQPGNEDLNDHLSHIKIGIDYSDQRRRDEAARRLAERFEQIDTHAASALQYKDIAACFEVLDDPTSAASWYHKAALVADEGQAEHAYCSYRYWRLLQALSSSICGVEQEQRWLDVFECGPERAEPLYQLAQSYIASEDWNKARSILSIALEIDPPLDAMPYEAWIYEYGLHYQAAQCARACGDDQGVLKHSVAAMTRQHALSPDIKSQLFEWQREAYEAKASFLPVSREERNHFVVIVPFRNCAEFLQACIDSLRVQRYRDFKVLFIDDASTDGGLVQCDLSGLPGYTTIQRQQRMEALENQVDALKNYCEPSDIAVFLDGDDRLADEEVFEYLNTVYAQTGSWFTYGQFSFDDSSDTGYARPILDTESVRSLYRGGLTFPIHMRTHRAGLIHSLQEQDPELQCLRSDDGRYFQRSSDVAHARAMMMITPRERIRYIPRVLYRYNMQNPQ